MNEKCAKPGGLSRFNRVQCLLSEQRCKLLPSSFFLEFSMFSLDVRSTCSNPKYSKNSEFFFQIFTIIVVCKPCFIPILIHYWLYTDVDALYTAWYDYPNPVSAGLARLSGQLSFHPIILNQTLNWRHAGSCSSSLLDFHKLSQVYTLVRLPEAVADSRSTRHPVVHHNVTCTMCATFLFDLEKKGMK